MGRVCSWFVCGFGCWVGVGGLLCVVCGLFCGWVGFVGVGVVGVGVVWGLVVVVVGVGFWGFVGKLFVVCVVSIFVALQCAVLVELVEVGIDFVELAIV
ncbi:hypothetical protein, partial [Pseudomonas syringae group genomosp. 7]|uniref:hypothetical protein n=1 Tax=Pseudomonas syringae group genomosp. 7 TaxID=251699 RepID=UPI0037705342